MGQLATVLTVMARKKVKAVPILMAFMAMVCSNNCEVSNSGPKIGQKWTKNGTKMEQRWNKNWPIGYCFVSHGQEKGESHSDPHGHHGYGM